MLKIKRKSKPENVHDKHAIKVMKNETIVGHVPRELSKYCSALINSDGRMWGIVSGKRENRRGNGLEVPCNYFVKRKKQLLNEGRALNS